MSVLKYELKDYTVLPQVKIIARERNFLSEVTFSLNKINKISSGDTKVWFVDAREISSRIA